MNIYSDIEIYRGLLLLSGLNVLYGLAGVLILPRKRKLGLLVMLIIAVTLGLLWLDVIIKLRSS